MEAVKYGDGIPGFEVGKKDAPAVIVLQVRAACCTAVFMCFLKCFMMRILDLVKEQKANAVLVH